VADQLEHLGAVQLLHDLAARVRQHDLKRARRKRRGLNQPRFMP
jgi:hypothetical protein